MSSTTLLSFNLDAQGATAVLIFSRRRDMFSLLTTSKTTSKIFDTSSVWQSYCYNQGIILSRNDLKHATRNDWKEFAMHLPRFRIQGNVGKDGAAWRSTFGTALGKKGNTTFKSCGKEAVGKKGNNLDELRRLVTRLSKVPRHNFRNGVHVPSLDSDIMYLVPLDFYETEVDDWTGYPGLGQSGVFTTMRNEITVSPGRRFVLEVDLQCCTASQCDDPQCDDPQCDDCRFQSENHFSKHDPRCDDPHPEDFASMMMNDMSVVHLNGERLTVEAPVSGTWIMKLEDIEDMDGEKMFLEFLGYTKDDKEEESRQEPGSRLYLKDGAAIRLSNIWEDETNLNIDYTIKFREAKELHPPIAIRSEVTFLLGEEKEEGEDEEKEVALQTHTLPASRDTYAIGHCGYGCCIQSLPFTRSLYNISSKYLKGEGGEPMSTDYGDIHETPLMVVLQIGIYDTDLSANPEYMDVDLDKLYEYV